MTNRLLKFEKRGCAPCLKVQNLLDSKGVEVEKIDVFGHPELSGKYDIGSVPTLILVSENGDELIRSIGFNPQEIEILISKL